MKLLYKYQLFVVIFGALTLRICFQSLFGKEVVLLHAVCDFLWSALSVDFACLVLLGAGRRLSGGGWHLREAGESAVGETVAVVFAMIVHLLCAGWASRVVFSTNRMDIKELTLKGALGLIAAITMVILPTIWIFNHDLKETKPAGSLERGPFK